MAFCDYARIHLLLVIPRGHTKDEYVFEVAMAVTNSNLQVLTIKCVVAATQTLSHKTVIMVRALT